MRLALEHAVRSRGIEANLESASRESYEVSERPADVAPGFQQPEGEVLSGTQSLGEGVAK